MHPKPSDPFVKRSTLRHLTRGETPSVRAVALQLHFGMVTALREGDGSIHATWKDVADWAGVSYASVKRAVIRLRELGWVRELSGHRIIFDYRRSCPIRPSEKAQIEPLASSLRETFQEGMSTHPSSPAPEHQPDVNPSGEGESVEPSVAGEAIRALVTAGVQRAGAVKAVGAARKAGCLSLERIRDLVMVVKKTPAYSPMGLLCAAVTRPELGAKLLRDAEMVARKARGTELPTYRLGGGCPVHTPETLVLSPWDSALEVVRSWRGLVANADDLRFLMGRSPNVPAEAVMAAVPEWSSWVS